MSTPSYLQIEIPQGIDPIEKLIELEPVMRHMIVNDAVGLEWAANIEESIAIITLTSYRVMNIYLILPAMTRFMPDTEAFKLLLILICQMDTLVNSIIGKNDDEIRALVEERERFNAVIDDILVTHYQLIDYLKSTRPTVQQDAV